MYLLTESILGLVVYSNLIVCYEIKFAELLTALVSKTAIDSYAF
ncbi:hypothetical protein CLV62_1231 [Dysgonomonas alginatilytica]|uniref:Uncharacterized protein n=1 Tax=Dysgonomonas alginatilytica TaxID=1605892 RepID=A0A2V3PN64_9BACT|nr:hypothetical protein CLV62_1231 [Dysgonomonas alginatilytica]